MVVSKKKFTFSCVIHIGNITTKQVGKFKYLGSMITVIRSKKSYAEIKYE